MGNKGTLNKWS